MRAQDDLGLKFFLHNPVTRGLIERPEDWKWSSFRHYLTSTSCVVEIESHWAAKRERMGIHPQVRRNENSEQ